MKYHTKCFMLLLGLVLWLTPIFFLRQCPYLLLFSLPGAGLIGCYWLDVVFKDKRFRP